MPQFSRLSFPPSEMPAQPARSCLDIGQSAGFYRSRVLMLGLIATVLRQNLIQQLTDRSMGLANRGAMIGSPGEIGVGKRNPAEGCGAQDLSRCRAPIFAEEKPRLGADVSVPPAVENNSGDVPCGLESGRGKHFTQLRPDLTLIIAKRCREQFRAAQIPLVLEWQPVTREENLEREHYRRIWPNGLRVRCKRWKLANCRKTTQPL